MIKRILDNRYVILALRLFLGGTFIWACYDKILHPERFAVSVDNYHVLPGYLVNLAAISLPWIELMIGLFLIFGLMTEAAALISAGLCLVFLAALIQALIRGLDISCGCFRQETGQEARINPLLALRDAALVLASLWILFYNKGRLSILCVIRRGTRES